MSAETKTCPFCEKPVNLSAIVCTNCGHHFNVQEDDGSLEAHLTSTERIPVPYRWLMLAACGLLIVGSLLPWGLISAPGMRMLVNGAEGDGVLTAGIGMVLLVITSLPERRSKDRRLAMIAGGVFSVLLLAPKLLELLRSGPMETQIYPGIVLAVFGAVMVILSALITREKNVRL